MNAKGSAMVPVGTPRRVFFAALVVGGVGLAIASLLGHVLVGVLFLAGLALGVGNDLMTTYSILKHIEGGDPDRKKFAFASLRRLLYVSAVAVLFIVVFHSTGIAVLAGLAVFHLFAALAKSMLALKELRKA